MIGIDTNILVRYCTEDDPAQSGLVDKLIDKHSGKRGAFLINNVVICELVWVLMRGYKYSKPNIIHLLQEMLSTIEFKFEDHSLLLNCIDLYKESDADFSDILIGYINKELECTQTLTFDNKASNLPTYQAMK